MKLPLLKVGDRTPRPQNPPVGSLIFNQATGHLLVWTGAQWCTVTPNAGSPYGANLGSATRSLMAAHRLEDEGRVKRFKSMVVWAVGGFALGRMLVFILEIVGNHYLS